MKQLPKHVRQVRDEMLASAKEAGLPRDAVYASQADEFISREQPCVAINEWSVCDNYEQGFGSFIATGEAPHKWAWRNPHTGEDSAMPGGFEEAMESARMFFTG